MVKTISVLLMLVPFGCANGPQTAQVPAQPAAAPQAKAATINNDPQGLIRNCGRPDNSNDSVWVQPGNAITSRSLTYSKAHLRVTYVSGGGQQWDFSNLVDTETNRALNTSDLQKVLQSRLPCALHGNSEVAQNTEAAGQRAGKDAKQRVSKADPDS